MKIYIPQSIDQAGVAYLTERGYEIIQGTGTDEETMLREIGDADGIIVRFARMTRSFMEGAPNLKVIARHGVGLDNVDLEAAREYGIRVTNAPYSNTESVAEQVVADMLALSRMAVQLDQSVRALRWNDRNLVRLSDLYGKTAGIIGYGRIGSLLAKKLHYAFDMRILAYSRHIKEMDLPDYVTIADSPEEIYRSTDYISLNCPLTEETRGMINKKTLSMMKPTAFLINSSRGPLVDESALADALKAKVIRGAALDVFCHEPVEEGNPLLALPDVILHPHTAALTEDGLRNMAVHAAMGADEVLTGKKVTWEVL